MSTDGLTIAEAAQSLRVSTRTVRRFIKAGKLSARLVPGPFGEEYRIAELPDDLHKQKAPDTTPKQTAVRKSVRKPAPTYGETADQLMNMVKELQEKNMTLAAQLGATTERIRYLENQVKLLTPGTTRKPWWQRLFSKKS